MVRCICLLIAAAALIAPGCAQRQPDRREALKPEEEERYPGLEVNPPDVYEYMEQPKDTENASEEMSRSDVRDTQAASRPKTPAQ